LRPASVLAAFLIFLTAAAAHAAVPPTYILVDVDSGKVLADHDSGKVWHPASLSKLMTAYVTFQALRAGRLKMTSPVTESANAQAEPPSKMGFQVGTVMNLDNALKMMLVHSANDIAVAIAEAVGGSEERFVAQMNATARGLGMNSTHYDNPNGLPDDGQLTTARDMAVLARALWVNFPEYRDYFRIPAIKAGRRVLRSQNMLLTRYPGSNGMKTGFICASGYNIVASATHGGRTMLAVVLGADSSNDRAETAAKLLNQGFAGALSGFTPVDLAGFRVASSAGPAADLHDAVCKGRHIVEEDDSPVLAGAFSPGSALEPPIQAMPPVVVFTGHTDQVMPLAPAATTKVAVDPAPAPAAAAVIPATRDVNPAPRSKGIPVPRLRPQYPAGAELNGFDFDQRFDPSTVSDSSGGRKVLR